MTDEELFLIAFEDGATVAEVFRKIYDKGVKDGREMERANNDNRV